MSVLIMDRIEKPYILTVKNPKTGVIERYNTKIGDPDEIKMAIDFWQDAAGYEVISFVEDESNEAKMAEAVRRARVIVSGQADIINDFDDGFEAMKTSSNLVGRAHNTFIVRVASLLPLRYCITYNNRVVAPFCKIENMSAVVRAQLWGEVPPDYEKQVKEVGHRPYAGWTCGGVV